MFFGKWRVKKLLKSSGSDAVTKRYGTKAIEPLSVLLRKKVYLFAERLLKHS